MTSPMLPYALQFHNEGLCVIPCRVKDKAPAVEIMGGTWEQYHNRNSTIEEIHHWWANGYNKDFNIGLVHRKLDSGLIYAALDIDHDSGLMTQLVNEHSYLFDGRIEQSGSGQGYHFPLFLESAPDWGYDQKQQRPRGNKTWKTDKGAINCRVSGCQTIAPPSIHPSGNPYKFIQTGDILRLPNLDSLIEWLDKLAPPPKPARSNGPTKPISPAGSDDLLNEVKAAWDCLKVFDYFGKAANQRKESDGEIRLLGNGGLLVTEDLQRFYLFSDDFGGGIFEAWGYCRVGSSYDNPKHFRQILLEMAEAAGIATDKRTGKPITESFPPLNIPPGNNVIIVAGEDKAEILKDAGFCAVGLPGNVFKRAWARLFDKDSTVYIALDPGKDKQAEAIAAEFKANGMNTFTCQMPVDPGKFFEYGGESSEFIKFLRQGKRQ